MISQSCAMELTEQEMALLEGGRWALGGIWKWVGVAAAAYDFCCGFVAGWNAPQDPPFGNSGGGW
ncbi:MAG TPA: lactococcin G-beta/enterocin 1071B family bacteriocin [bacterium]